jgi:hypothetical protein
MPSSDSATGLLCAPIFIGWVAIVLATGFWLWMLSDAVTHEPSDYASKAKWVAVIFLTYVFGAAAYFYKRRPVRMAQHGK